MAKLTESGRIRKLKELKLIPFGTSNKYLKGSASLRFELAETEEPAVILEEIRAVLKNHFEPKRE